MTSTPLSDDELALQIRQLTASIDVAVCRLIALLVEFDDRRLWGEMGHRSCAHWLSSHCGIALGAAREKLRVGRALQALPKVREALEDGTLSYSKARAITRVASGENEDFLLGIARYGSASHLEGLVSRYRGSLDAHKREEERQRAASMTDFRSLTHRYDEHGMLIIHARLTPEQGALFVKSLEVAEERLADDRPLDPADAHPDVSAETSSNTGGTRTDIDRIDARRADALSLLANVSLSASCSGERSSADRHHVTVIVDADTLAGTDAGDAAECHVQNGPGLPLDTVRRLCCDGPISGIAEKDGQVLSVGRRTRAIPSSLRRAMLRRDRGCRFPGCGAHRFVDGHHIRHWADGGETSLDNLVTCCTHHHRLLHEGGFSVALDATGTVVFRTPAGRVVEEQIAPLTSTDRSPMPSSEPSDWRWDGSSLDWCVAVEELQRTRPEFSWHHSA